MPGQEPECHKRRAAPWRFSLSGLLGLMTVVCVWLTLLALWTTECKLTFQCGKMPPNDHALIAWLQRQEGTRDVRVTRDENSVTVRFDKREIFATLDGLSPPLEDLGYGDVETIGISWTSGWQAPFRTAFQWLLRNYWLIVGAALAALLLAIYVISRKLRNSSQVETGPENPQRVT